jgi:hypothetical protein
MTNKHVPKGYARRGWALITALVLLTAAYLMGSRALDTGSWQQYGLTFVFLVFGLNRLFRGIWLQKAN